MKYNQPGFIEDDPISIPHSFSKHQDIEISAFFSATLAWGLRKTIISKCNELMQLMDQSPHDFILNHSSSDLIGLTGFKHRTFNSTDLLYFVHFLKKVYQKSESLEDLFLIDSDEDNIERGINNFFTQFVDDEFFPPRTTKHVAAPVKKSACKRLNMFLRWMVRTDQQGVDFGIWNRIKPAQLICPCDVHVEKVARSIGLISRKQIDWLTAVELTQNLKDFDPLDPVKYDYALFGMGLDNAY